MRSGIRLLVFSVLFSAPCVSPGATIEPLGLSCHRLDWTGEEGLTYFPQYSVDLVNWSHMPEIAQGAVHDPVDFLLIDKATGAPYPRCFVRLKISDFPSLDPKGADFDGDGASNWRELTELGTDPLNAYTGGGTIPDGQVDTDGDGISDQWELMLIAQAGDPAAMGLEHVTLESDFDGDDVLDYLEYERGLSGYRSDSDGDGYGDRLSVDLELHLRLDEESGPNAPDAGGLDRHGLLVGSPVWQPLGGIENGALQFGGGSDAVDLSAAVLDGAGDLTISLWFKTSSTADSQTILSSANDAHYPELAISLEKTTLADDTVRFDDHSNGAGIQSFDWVCGRSLADDLWHHLVLVRDFDNSQVTLYLDGVPAGPPQSGTSFVVLDVEDLVLAQRHATATDFDPASVYIGLLDEVRIYSAMLDPKYVPELFQPNDIDADGLPDDWEIDWVQDLVGLAGADGNLDGDGFTNRQEFYGGTAPNDYYNGQTPVVTLEDGGGQEIHNGQRTEEPLVFKVTSDGTTPLVNAPVTFRHLVSLLGSLETLDGDILATTLTLRTDDDGKVAVHFKAD